MVLKETYFAVLDQVKKENPSAIFISVARKTPSKAPVDEIILALAPSQQLIDDWNDGKGISEGEYIHRYLEEIWTDEAKLHINLIKNMALTKDVYLVCYERSSRFCHRFILLDMMGMKQKTKQTKLF